MSAVFDAYNLPIEHLAGFYRRINQPVTYPDGMTTSLGIIYWGRTEHLEEIDKAIPKFLETGNLKFSDVLQSARTPALSKKLSEQAGISGEILRILKHDISLWLPQAIPLDQIGWFKKSPDTLDALVRLSLADQLAVISAGQTPIQRENVALHTGLAVEVVGEIVKLCDFYRTGKNLEHIRAKIYYDMGMDTWQKWAGQTSEAIIAMFSRYIQEKALEGERLIPWPKEVRNGIEWARMHLEVFAVAW